MTTKADTTDTIRRNGIFSIVVVVVVVKEKDGIQISTQRNSPYENSAILYIGNTAGRCCGTCSDSEGILIVVEMFESAEFNFLGFVATTTYSTTRRNSDYLYIIITIISRTTTSSSLFHFSCSDDWRYASVMWWTEEKVKWLFLYFKNVTEVQKM